MEDQGLRLSLILRPPIFPTAHLLKQLKGFEAQLQALLYWEVLFVRAGQLPSDLPWSLGVPNESVAGDAPGSNSKVGPRRPNHFLIPSAQFQKRAGTWLGPSTSFWGEYSFGQPPGKDTTTSGGKRVICFSVLTNQPGLDWTLETAMEECEERPSLLQKLLPSKEMGVMILTWQGVGGGASARVWAQIVACLGAAILCVCKCIGKRQVLRICQGALG